MATSQQVIGALLTKFNIVDNVMKFALYERTFDDSRQQLGKRRKTLSIFSLSVCLSVRPS